MNLPTTAFARSKDFWRHLGWGLASGALGAIGAFVFLVLMNLGLSLVWPEPPGPEPFSGSWQIVAIMTVAGLVVGLMRRSLPVENVDVFSAVIKGHMETRPIPGALLVALTSLIGGFSLGPEVPTGMGGAALGSWLSERRKLSAESERVNVLSGVMGAYGGLFSSPFAATMIPLEVTHTQSPAYYGTIIIGAAAAVFGFLLFFFQAGDQFSSLLRFLDLPTYDLKVWHIVMALIFGVVGTVLAIIFGVFLRIFKRLALPLVGRPILHSTLAGLLLGLLGFALPLTLFLGTDGLVTVTTQAAQLGVALLAVVVLAKMAALAGALAGGFIGGPIFPLLFVGGTAGVVINLLFPGIPQALSVSCMMAAVPGAVLPIPLTLSVIVLLITGVPPTEVIPVVVAALAAYFITHGFGLIGD
jgi:chloride channel protein, CIC family